MRQWEVPGQQHDGEGGGLFKGDDLWGLVIEAQDAAKDELVEPDIVKGIRRHIRNKKNLYCVAAHNHGSHLGRSLNKNPSHHPHASHHLLISKRHDIWWVRLGLRCRGQCQHIRH